MATDDEPNGIPIVRVRNDFLCGLFELAVDRAIERVISQLHGNYSPGRARTARLAGMQAVQVRIARAIRARDGVPSGPDAPLAYDQIIIERE